jgi:Bacterial PH domain
MTHAKPPLPNDPEFALGEQVLYSAHPAMFRNHPIGFILSLLLAPVGIGLVILLFWWLQVKATSLTVTDRRVSMRTGILSKNLNDIFHNDVRNIRINQTLFQRFFRTGSIGISSSGQSGIEIEVAGLPDPERIKGIIDRYR